MYQSIHVISQKFLVKGKYSPQRTGDKKEEPKPNESVSDKFLNMGLEDLLSVIKKDKNTSSEMQNYLKTTSLENVRTVMSKINGHALDLSFDKYGNYIVQIILDRVEEYQHKLADLAIDNFNELVENEFGSRVLQKLLKNKKFSEFSL
jgi:hypothetical protein